MKKSGFLVMVDDPGLIVKSLSDESGIFPARYAAEDVNGEDRINKIKARGHSVRFVYVDLLFI